MYMWAHAYECICLRDRKQKLDKGLCRTQRCEIMMIQGKMKIKEDKIRSILCLIYVLSVEQLFVCIYVCMYLCMYSA
jgi:hypothetical protein